MEAAWLWLPFLAVLMSQGAAKAALGTCFTLVDPRTGACSKELLTQTTTRAACCQNPNYGFALQGQACVACRKAYLSEWSDWSACSSTCQGGVRSRVKTCVGHGACDHSLPLHKRLQVQLCNQDTCCPELGSWGAWGQWSGCSGTCGAGKTHRTRVCEGVKPCGVRCPGSHVESMDCETGQLCPTHGAWGPWQSWGQCSKTCRDDGAVRKRSRACNSPAPSTVPAGMPCAGPPEDTGQCYHLAHCPVHGAWSLWGSWSGCSATCGLGTMVRTRNCDRPPPQHGGRHCSDAAGGQDSQAGLCNSNKQCLANGKWTEWAAWTPCLSNTPYPNRCRRRVGRQSMQRNCLGMDEGGALCEGTGFIIRACYNLENCTVAELQVNKPEWGGWGEWGLCKPPCGRCSTSVRRRTCKTPLPPWKTDFLIDTSRNISIVFWGTPLEQCQPTADVQQERRCPALTACPRGVDDGCKNVPPPPACGDGGSGNEGGSGENNGDVDCEN